MTEFRVNLDKEKALLREMARLGVRQEDILEDFVRSRGPGGQNVNKVSTCVYLKHLPTGIEVKCQRERSQVLNRYLARKILLRKIDEQRLKKIADQRSRLEKIKRQNRKRSKQAKLRILEGKRRRSEKKMLRAKIKETLD